MKDIVNKVANTVSASGNIGLAIYGEYLQDLVGKKVIDYQPIMGHISDFAGAAAFTSLYFLGSSLLKIDEKFSYATAGMLGAVWSGIELSHKYFPSATDTYDPKDIGAYWLGIGLACGINHLSKKKSNHNLENKL